jgi:co-chaperonin GroES (HSP10)
MTKPNLQQYINSLDRRYDKSIIEDGWKEEMDLNHEWWEKMSYVEKPKEFIERDFQLELQRQGATTTELFEPLENEIFIEMGYSNSSLNLVLSETRHQEDVNFGIIIKGKLKKYKTGQKVIIDVSKIQKRFNYKDKIHLVIKEEDIIATYV